MVAEPLPTSKGPEQLANSAFSAAPGTAQPLLNLQTPLPAPSSPSSYSLFLKVLFRRTRVFIILGLPQAAQMTGGSEKQALLAADQAEPHLF